MTSFDLSPLFRTTIGFDRMARLLDAVERRSDDGYPPYNIEKVGEDAYRISMAVAGFGADGLDITVQENRLVVTGKAEAQEGDVKYLHRGIGGRAFERRFDLADHIVVKGGSLNNGLLHIDLARELPEAMKPRTIKISAARSARPVLESKAA